MNILIGCEVSQILCQAFRKAGFDAYSCDLMPTMGDPTYHYQLNIVECFNLKAWDLIIFHPPCTAMCLSGNRWYGKGKPKAAKRQAAVDFAMILWKLACQKAKHVALENPTSVIFKHLYNVQYVQPWQFGHPVNKLTGFALKNLPRLKPTNIVDNPKDLIHNMPESENRSILRSMTFPGIADAIVDQWGSYIKANQNN